MPVVLAFTTSQKVGGVALLTEDELLSREIPAGEPPSGALFPAVLALLAEAGRPKSAISCLATDIGPGSYTGIRVGLAALKLSAFALDRPGFGIPTLDLLARAAWREATDRGAGRIAVCLEAYQGQLYVGTYTVGAGGPEVERTGAVLDPDGTRPLVEGALVVGTAAPRFGPEAVATTPDARVLAQMARERLAVTPEGDDIVALVPLYLRPSAAELKRIECGDRPSGWSPQ